jgi:aspartate aminotransferase
MSQLGTEAAFRVPARASELQRAGHDVVNQYIGQPDFQTPDHIIEAGRKALADGHHGCTLANGVLPLREVVVADLYRRHRVSLSPAQVLVVPGGKVTMFLAIMMFGEEGTEIIYPNPASQPTRASSQ